MRFDRGHFLSALAGLTTGALLLGALPGLASTGDYAVVGAWNRAGKQTVFTATAGATVQIRNTNANGIPLVLKASLGRPPMQVNSAGHVANLNADLLDGEDGSHYRTEFRSCSNDDIPDGVDWTCSVGFPTWTSGTFMVVGSVDMFANGTLIRPYCRIYVDGVAIDAADRDVDIEDGRFGECATNGVKGVAAGSHTVDFRLLGTSAQTQPGQGSMFILFLPAP